MVNFMADGTYVSELAGVQRRKISAAEAEEALSASPLTRRGDDGYLLVNKGWAVVSAPPWGDVVEAVYNHDGTYYSCEIPRASAVKYFTERSWYLSERATALGLV